MSTSVDEALSRAKAIAARLSGEPDAGQPSPPKAPTSTKRKRWGVAPSALAAQSSREALPGLADAAKKLKQATEPSKKRIWVNSCRERPEAHFFAFFDGGQRLTELGDKINREAGIKDDAADSGKVIVKLEGRGSSDRPALPGMPEEPMHIMIYGPEDLIAKANSLVEELLIDAERAPVSAAHLEGKDDQYNETTKNSLALTAVVPVSHSSGYKPATVAQLISQNPVLTQTGDMMEETVDVPNGVVGYLIGRGGETISSMQARSGCKIQIQKEHDLQPGQTHRVITLQAVTQDSIDRCRGMIESMVQDRIRAAGGSTSTNGSKDMKVNEALAAGHSLVEVDVPDADVGLIIGKSGATIKSIQDTTGASIQIPPTGNPDDPSVRTVRITHPNEAGAAQAKQQIENLLKSKPSYAQSQGTQTTIQVLIPDRDVGLCIGRQGCVIREMQQKTGTRIQIPSQPTPGQPHRIATVTGSQDGCNKVQGLIERIVNEQSSACVMSGTPFNSQKGSYLNQQLYGGQQQSSEYSAEWQAYYAAQAMAGQPQQQQQQQPQPAPAAAAPAPGADAYYEQFFRYAYYYGEDAARQYYGAWSPPPGTPNPYGVNPQGITPAPAAAAPAPQQAAAQPQNVSIQQQRMAARDTSQRKVSNLPAWMTRN